MPIRIFQVDAFSSEPFRGNPAAVCILDEPRDGDWMQRVATEMNLSETAFVSARSPNRFDLRWMTPEMEVDLCGHATLASAHILFSHGFVDPKKPITFYSRSGPLPASIVGDEIELNFPSLQYSEVSEIPAHLQEAIHRKLVKVSKSGFDYLVELSHETKVHKLRPNFTLLRAVGMRGLIVTAPADAGKPYDFVSRAFFPALGIAEDPVTGSAHCLLGPYWLNKLHKSSMVGYQDSKRGGTVKLQVDGDRVKLFGKAVTIFEGELKV
jgi:PhzF family phenazine biosynthesis protein